MARIRIIIFNNQYVATFIAASVFLLIAGFGEMFLRTQQIDLINKQRIEAISYTSMLRARAERELNSLLYLNSGLGSYLVVRNDSIQGKEVSDILAVLYRSSRHVRNFGIAIGYRLTFVYPRTGNESAIGLNYQSQSDQWPLIEKISQSGESALAGPVKLVQGGNGLVYRVPLSIGGNYWGMLSTVIDADSFFKAIFEEYGDSRYTYAVRGKDGQGMQGGPVWGDITLFSQPSLVKQEIEIPGGHWVIGVAPKVDKYLNNFPILVRLLTVTIAAVIAWMLYMLIRSRADLTSLAMYDQLTSLPNRHLLEDRARMAIARQQRHPDRLSALLFLDLDGFKPINDQYGHMVGDVLLRTTAERAKSIVRLNDTVARWGGDEFVILLENLTQSVLDNLITRLREEIESPIEVAGRSIKVGVSIGVAIFPEKGSTLEEMLRMADKRMYDEKAFRKMNDKNSDS